MGEIRKEQAKESTGSLIKKYHTFNAEGRKAAYDELRRRGKIKEANMLRPKRKIRRQSGLFSRGSFW